MSGGVDSAVAAALSVRAGHEVFGVMLRLWSEPGACDENTCCSRVAVDAAAAVAAQLGIAFGVLDAASTFARSVVDTFVDAVRAVETPNPCVACNRDVRFGTLLRQARALGADVLVTGHYARVERAQHGAYRLRRGVDLRKDQSYVLHALGQAQLASVEFPLGALDKPAVRALAAEMGLPVARRPDSVDLCWLGGGGLDGFLARSVRPDEAVGRPGPIVDAAGRRLGEHRGLAHYTIGQRRGLGVATGAAVYVVARDAAANTLVVGPEADLYHDTVHVRELHWISGVPPVDALRVAAQVRYRAAAAPATLVPAPGARATVRFDRPQRAPTPGQALVIYDGDVCLGGGTIAGVGAG